MQLADALIQSDLQCIQAIHFLSVCLIFKELLWNNFCEKHFTNKSELN